MAENEEGKGKEPNFDKQIYNARETITSNSTMQSSSQDGETNEDVEPQQQHIHTKLDRTTNNCSVAEDIFKIEQKPKNNSDYEEKLNTIEYNSFILRQKVLEMELDIVKKFSRKELIENDNDTLKEIQDINTYVDNNQNKPNINNNETSLLAIENLSTRLMKTIKKVIKAKKEKNLLKVEIPKDDQIEVPNYRSIVTVKGTEEDVRNCIKKAKKALDDEKFDRAISLLEKAERMVPTVTARDLLKVVLTKKELQQNPKPTITATKVVEQVNTVNEEELQLVDDRANAAKSLECLRKALKKGNLAKAERMLIRAKRFDPLLDVKKEQSLIKAAKTKEGKLKQDRINANNTLAAYDSLEKAEPMSNSLSFDNVDMEEQPLQVKPAIKIKMAEEIKTAPHATEIDPLLYLQLELSETKTKMENIVKSTKRPVEENEKPKAKKTVYKIAKKQTADDIYNAQNFKESEQNANSTNTFEHETIDSEFNSTNYGTQMAFETSTEPELVISDTVTIQDPETFSTTEDADWKTTRLEKKRLDNLLLMDEFEDNTNVLNTAEEFHSIISAKEPLEVISQDIYEIAQSTFNSEEAVQICEDFIKQAEIAYRNRDFNENKRLLIIAKSYYPSQTVDYMLRRVEKNIVENQIKSSHSMVTHETMLPSLKSDKPKETELPTATRRKEMVEMETKSRELLNDIGNEVRNNFAMPQVMKRRATRERLNDIELNEHTKEEMIEDVPEIDQCTEDPEENLEENMGEIYVQVMNDDERNKSQHYDNYYAVPKIRRTSPKEDHAKNMLLMTGNANHDENFEEVSNFLNTAKQPFDSIDENNRNLTEPTHSITTYEKMLPCLKNKTQKETKMQISTNRNETVENELNSGEDSDEVVEEVTNNVFTEEASIPPQLTDKQTTRERLIDSKKNSRKEIAENASSMAENANYDEIFEDHTDDQNTAVKLYSFAVVKEPLSVIRENIILSGKPYDNSVHTDSSVQGHITNDTQPSKCNDVAQADTQEVQTNEIEAFPIKSQTNCKTQIALVTSIEPTKMVIPETVNINIYGTFNTEEDVAACEDFIREAAIAYRNQDYSEYTRLLTLAKSNYPSVTVKDMVERIEKKIVEYQTKPSFSNEKILPCLLNKKQTETHMATQSKETVDKEMKELDEVVNQVRNSVVRGKVYVPPPQPMKRQSIRERLNDDEQNNHIKEKVDKEKSKITKDELEINKPFKNQGKNIEHNKDEIEIAVDNNAKQVRLDEDDKQESEIAIKLMHVDEFVKKAQYLIEIGDLENAKCALQHANDIYATTYVNSLLDYIDKCLENSKVFQHCVDHDTDGSTRPSPNEEYNDRGEVNIPLPQLIKIQTTTEFLNDIEQNYQKEESEHWLSIAEQANLEAKFDDDMNFINTAEKTHITELLADLNEELFEVINKSLISRKESYEDSDYYEYPDRIDVANKAEPSKCNNTAQATFQDIQKGKIETTPNKPVQTCSNQGEILFPDIVYNTNVEYGTNDPVLSQNNNEYYNRRPLMKKKSEENVHIMKKAKPEKQQKHIQAVKPSLSSNATSITTKSHKELIREKRAEMFECLAIETMTMKCKNFRLAHHYLESALEIRPNKQTREHLVDVKREIDNRNEPILTKKVVKKQANVLLDKASKFITAGDWEKAEFHLTVSWDMKRMGRTELVYREFLKSRMKSFNKELKKGFGEKNNPNNIIKNKNVNESDKLVFYALNKYQNKKFDEASRSLRRASELNPSKLIDKVLADIEQAERKIQNQRNLRTLQILIK